MLGAGIAVAAILILWTTPSPAAAKACANQNAVPGQVSASTAERATFCLLNKQRTKRDVPKLKRNKLLDKPSAQHSRLMVKQNCFEHVCPGEASLGERLDAYLGDEGGGYGENLAYGGGELGSPRAIVKAWMNSEGHRRNILDPDFVHIGIGIVWGSPVRVGGSGGTYTTDFGYRN